ncbi:DcaP family trimeric outer membrane transporter [Marinobacter nanhaiticus D15-8W]|uniref:Porin n=1 Tax=Marinobacter nanhaiticus D15-8W TaxID=626887 RepID=N6WUS1_9GAMM|nr:DcaP family trimeric outer membrane transporter [Marinobacter nanhaiticus]ENO14737.1 hypothetical protein J057_05281 [Marinobacter nanhaiticus D15-8W]BES69575.1 DcaP family trimeric outer membrane transporter [Marinobacter nanhaiticus D15-8W]
MLLNTRKNLLALSVGTLSLLAASSLQAADLTVNKTDIDLYGYAKLDLIYDVDADLGNTIIRSKIRLDDEDGVDGHTNMHAFQSRLGLKTSTPVAGDTLKTVIEGDFYGNNGFGGGGGEFRLRHAYGTWNGILAGQTWSNFGNVLSLYQTVDFNGSLGQGGGRQAQVRYTTGPFSFSAEDPEGSGAAGGDIQADGTNQYRLPDLTARYQSSVGPVKYAAAALVRFLEYDAEGSDTANPNWDDDSATGWGLMVEANTKLTDSITIRGSISHGDGIGGYIYLSPAGPGYVDGDGNLETIEATGGGVSMTVNAGPGAFNLGYGLVIADLDDGYESGDIAATTDERYSSTFVNYIWSPFEQLTYGVEAGYHTREQVNGDEGDAVRLQAMIQYGF